MSSLLIFVYDHEWNRLALLITVTRAKIKATYLGTASKINSLQGWVTLWTKKVYEDLE
jgi:hypothetical protein